METRRVIVKQGKLVKRTATHAIEEVMSLMRSTRDKNITCTKKLFGLYRENLCNKYHDKDDDEDLSLRVSLTTIQYRQHVQKDLREQPVPNAILKKPQKQKKPSTILAIQTHVAKKTTRQRCRDAV